MSETITVRLDKWLWAARFFKTRSIATQAVNGGKVHCNAKRVKAAKTVQIGDELVIQRGQVTCTVIVDGLNDKRRPAKEAVALYTETPDSIKSREESSEQKRLMRTINGNYGPQKRPSKRDRRLIINFTRKSEIMELRDEEN
nr:RNA-binding protein [Desulfobulbaceae bacterium]